MQRFPAFKAPRILIARRTAEIVRPRTIPELRRESPIRMTPEIETSVASSSRVIQELNEERRNIENLSNTVASSSEQLRQQRRRSSLLNQVSDLLQNRIGNALLRLTGGLSAMEDCCEEVLKKLDALMGRVNELEENLPLKILGQSYYGVDGLTTYAPTIVIKFTENINSSYRRARELKLKLSKTSDEITDELIQELRTKFQDLRGFTYVSGSSRGYYVENRFFKTTVYGNTRDDVVKVLTTFLPLVEVEFNENKFSFTEKPIRERPNIRRRQTADILLNEIKMHDPYEVRLFRAHLLINGTTKPHLLFDN
jgi:hypothetical protein